ncbi:hypothetical protein [Desulfotalea psychrophila]|uniref:Uncharacterized protein n=1 Tax=Desulfotalea psychrophila (strain LSv54 / DSM 12343) TaxID=177439 RepID=Q6APT4_DESPS|nr:hypothetical protein [Desulfotalea psychrophila]CAG35640.1 unknown protein [Desulfotalea psychrophila LSv54]
MTKKKMFDKPGKTTEKAQENIANKDASIQAMVWYKEEHWDTLMSLFNDAELLPQSYQAWLKRAEAKKQEVEAEGDQVIKVFIDPETFPAWCEENNLTMNSEARAQLAIEVAQAQSFSL